MDPHARRPFLNHGKTHDGSKHSCLQMLLRLSLVLLGRPLGPTAFLTLVVRWRGKDGGIRVIRVFRRALRLPAATLCRLFSTSPGWCSSPRRRSRWTQRMRRVLRARGRFLRNSCQKIVAKALPAPLGMIAQTVVHSVGAQCARGICGRAPDGIHHRRRRCCDRGFPIRLGLRSRPRALGHSGGVPKHRLGMVAVGAA